MLGQPRLISQVVKTLRAIQHCDEILNIITRCGRPYMSHISENMTSKMSLIEPVLVTSKKMMTSVLLVNIFIYEQSL